MKKAGGRGAGEDEGDKGDEGEINSKFKNQKLLPPASCLLFPNAQKQDPPSRLFHRARGITYMVVYNWFGIVAYESIL